MSKTLWLESYTYTVHCTPSHNESKSVLKINTTSAYLGIMEYMMSADMVIALNTYKIHILETIPYHIIYIILLKSILFNE